MEQHDGLEQIELKCLSNYSVFYSCLSAAQQEYEFICKCINKCIQRENDNEVCIQLRNL